MRASLWQNCILHFRFVFQRENLNFCSLFCLNLLVALLFLIFISFPHPHIFLPGDLGAGSTGPSAIRTQSYATGKSNKKEKVHYRSLPGLLGHLLSQLFFVSPSLSWILHGHQYSVRGAQTFKGSPACLLLMQSIPRPQQNRPLYSYYSISSYLTYIIHFPLLLTMKISLPHHSLLSPYFQVFPRMKLLIFQHLRAMYFYDKKNPVRTVRESLENGLHFESIYHCLYFLIYTISKWEWSRV